jgi:hypothetical protein
MVKISEAYDSTNILTELSSIYLLKIIERLAWFFTVFSWSSMSYKLHWVQ